MKYYTEKKHVANLEKMLGSEDPCVLCPNEILLEDAGMQYYWFSEDAVCKKCRGFIGMKGAVSCFPDERCPCHVLGKKEALKRTWLALEEKGYS